MPNPLIVRDWYQINQYNLTKMDNAQAVAKLLQEN